MRMIEELDGREPALGYYRFARAEPAPHLQPFVREYIGYMDQAAVCVRRRELPLADTVIIINLGASWRMLDSELNGQFDSFAAGVRGQFSLVESTGNAHCYHMNLTPLGGSRFFGLPMRELSGKAQSLSELIGRDLGALRERLFEARSWSEGFRVLDDFVSRRIERARPARREIAWVVSELERTRGNVRIGDLAEQLGYSRKHLRERFLDCVGTPAKQLAQLLRFNHVVERMQTLRRDAPERQLAALALACGYADHAHLTREFRRFSGWSPSEYRRQHTLGDGVIVASY